MSHVGAAFAYSQYWGMYADRYEFELVSSVMSNLYVQYFTNVTPSFQSDRFAAPDKFSRRAWATYYLKALPQLETVLEMTENTKYAEEAVAAGVMETAGDDAFLIATSSSTTPYGWLSAWGETYMSEAMQSVLVGYEDPRLPIFFNKPVDESYNSNYRGARNGINSI